MSLLPLGKWFGYFFFLTVYLYGYVIKCEAFQLRKPYFFDICLSAKAGTALHVTRKKKSFHALFLSFLQEFQEVSINSNTSFQINNSHFMYSAVNIRQHKSLLNNNLSFKYLIFYYFLETKI